MTARGYPISTSQIGYSPSKKVTVDLPKEKAEAGSPPPIDKAEAGKMEPGKGLERVSSEVSVSGDSLERAVVSLQEMTE